MTPLARASLLLGVLAATPATAQTLRYEPAPGATYERVQRDRVSQTVDGGEQTAEIESFWRFTAVFEPEEDGVAVEVVHDSIAIESDPPQRAPDDFSPLYGQPVRVEMTPRGEVRRVALPDSLPPVARRLDLGNVYRSFFPTLPRGPALPGEAWSDTTRVESNQNGLDLAVTRIDRYVARGDTALGGEGAVRIDYETDLVLEGRGRQRETAVSLTGTGSGGGTFWFRPDPGLYLGGSESTEMRMAAFVASDDGSTMLIPILQTRTETIRRIE